MRKSYFPIEENQEIRGRVYLLFSLIVVVLVIYVVQAYLLQVEQGDYFRGLADNNRMRMVPIEPPRGLIYDRHGALLVNNIPEFNLYAVVGDMPDPEVVLNRLVAFADAAQIDRLRNKKIGRKERFSPVKIKGGLSLDEIARIEGNQWNLPGSQVTAELKRNSIYGPLVAHSVGYVGEISKAQIKSGIFPNLLSGDEVGQFGVEQMFDALIRGTPGKKWMEVDVLGRELKILKVSKPIVGNDLFLTLDLKLQKVADEALGEERGAIVAMNPRNGEVLAMVSHPAFDPNIFSRETSPSLLRSLINDSARPLMNRAIHAQYPPGSTFKIVVGTALLESLEEAALPPTVFCRGSLWFGNRSFRDWKKEGHGTVNFHRSLVESCDVYYYQMGDRLGVDIIAKFSNLLGLGRPTGIGLANEKSGLIPSTTWKQERLNAPWYRGETLSVAIGQGYVLVTPLQMAVMISAVANGGTVYTPKLLQKSRDSQTGVVSTAAMEKGRHAPILGKTLETVRAALTDVVASPRGTASRSRSALVSLAGKTGTAQVVVLKPGEKREKLAKAVDDHAWFVAYAPTDHPQIALAVLVEHGGHGGAVAAPMAKKIIEAYMGGSSLSSTPPVKQNAKPLPL
jgi:penicillin-binding protein 2